MLGSSALAGARDVARGLALRLIKVLVRAVGVGRVLGVGLAKRVKLNVPVGRHHRDDSVFTYELAVGVPEALSEGLLGAGGRGGGWDGDAGKERGH